MRKIDSEIKTNMSLVYLSTPKLATDILVDFIASFPYQSIHFRIRVLTSRICHYDIFLILPWNALSKDFLRPLL